MFVSVLGQLAVAIALQSYTSSDDRDARVQCTHRAGRLEDHVRVEGKDDDDDGGGGENAFRIREDVRLRLLGQFHFKRWVAFSLVSMGVLATIANILLLVTGAVTEEQLQETTGAVLQYCTVAHVMAAHVSYVKDMQAYRDSAKGFSRRRPENNGTTPAPLDRRLLGKRASSVYELHGSRSLCMCGAL